MIRIITKGRMKQIIDHPFLDVNKGKFLDIDGDQFICCDNSSGNAWVEKFSCIVLATKWLNGMFECSDLSETELARIHGPGKS